MDPLKRPTAWIICLCGFAIALVTTTLLAHTPTASSNAPLQLNKQLLVAGFDRPVSLAQAGDGRLFVVEKAGRIKIITPSGAVLPTSFLDISARVDSSENEEGLLGLTFHPNHPTDPRFFVNYTYTINETRYSRISSFTITGNPDVANPDSENVLLTVVQPEKNHNAGDLHFSPADGYLYIPLGDGGGSGDPNNLAQNQTTLLGKIVRIDVNRGPGSAPDCVGNGSGDYTIPASNPFADGPGGNCDETWASGLRNPWRSSFDRQTGDFWLGDVGQGAWEEVNFQPASSIGGENYGWRCYEGNAPFNSADCGASSSYTFPAFDYSSIGDCSVIGGYVYRGRTYPEMVGHYLFTDFCTGNFWDIIPNGSSGWTVTQHTNLTGFGYVAFGEDHNGELYLIQGNDVYRLIEETSMAPPLPPTATPVDTDYLPIMEQE